jgi:hypothetical protein
MAPSEWTHYVRAVRDTLVADYAAPRINSKRRVPYRPLIAVSPLLVVLAVSYFRRSLGRCSQLSPYVGMGSLVPRLHQDCIGIAMRWVTLRKSLLAFLLPARKMQFSLH